MVQNTAAELSQLGINNPSKIHYNLSAEQLANATLEQKQGVLSDKGALVIRTGKFTGRSPKDRYIVLDRLTQSTVDWGIVNIPVSVKKFDALYDKVCAYLDNKEIYVREAFACANPDYRLDIRLITEFPWSNLFGYNMFLRPDNTEFKPDWTILCAPGFLADPEEDGTRNENFAIINFSKKCIIIGGTGYTGEIKKGIFSVLNFLLPHKHNVLTMHCSANYGQNSDTAVFFGLSGTGKTTLSTDPERELIGDDEHGWSDQGVFNFEGGCYAKCIDLSAEKEPEIYKAIKPGAVLENIIFKAGTNEPDYNNDSITQNTRVSYPIFHIPNARKPSAGGHPSNIFFLTCDAFGVLPPISKLTPGQAMYHFISGYTAKVAGTEEGITEPQTTFSACFGAPFLPLHPTQYAEMLGDKMKKHEVNVWMVNTGWTGGSYGVGSRIKLKFTRAMISAALKGQLDKIEYVEHEIFGLLMPTMCPGVPDNMLNPMNTWQDESEYKNVVDKLALAFVKNFRKFESKAATEILEAAPKVGIASSFK